MARLTVSAGSTTPVYRQIVQQVRHQIASGQLRPGDRLPPSRLLAENLRVNRNTVAKAYRCLRDEGLISTHGAAGTVVTGLGARLPARDPLDPIRDSLTAAVRDAVAFGLTPDEVGAMALGIAQGISAHRLRIAFVECNEERAIYFSKQLSELLQAPVEPLLIEALGAVAVEADLLITTFFHLAEVRRWVRASDTPVETAAVVVGPHLQTLMRIAEFPPGSRVAVRYTTEHQAAQVRDWIVESGVPGVEVIPGHDPVPADVDALVIPSERPDLGDGAHPRTTVIEFGNLLDEASIASIREIVRELQGQISP